MKTTVLLSLIIGVFVFGADAKKQKKLRKAFMQPQTARNPTAEAMPMPFDISAKPANVQAAITKAINNRRIFEESLCTDAVSFPGNKYAGFNGVTVDAWKALGKDEKYMNQASYAIVMRSGDYDNIVSQVGQRVIENKVGCCSTFAAAMASIIAPDATAKGPKVEVVCVGSGPSGTHCFCVVGRAEGTIGDYSTWGAAATVIDPWLMSLGHIGINLSPKDGPRADKGESLGYTGATVQCDKPEVL